MSHLHDEINQPNLASDEASDHLGRIHSGAHAESDNIYEPTRRIHDLLVLAPPKRMLRRKRPSRPISHAGIASLQHPHDGIEIENAEPAKVELHSPAGTQNAGDKNRSNQDPEQSAAQCCIHSVTVIFEPTRRIPANLALVPPIRLHRRKRPAKTSPQDEIILANN